MKHPVWVLVEHTNVVRRLADETHEQVDRLWTFDSFEQAKEEMGKLIGYHATTENELFDGNGYIHELEPFIKEQLEDSEGVDFRSVPFLQERVEAFKRCATALRETLPSFCKGDRTALATRFAKGFWTNHKEEWKVEQDDDGETTFFFGDRECDEQPWIYMRCIEMTHPEQSYCFYLRLGNPYGLTDDSFIKIDLVCCEMNETPEEEFLSGQD